MSGVGARVRNHAITVASLAGTPPLRLHDSTPGLEPGHEPEPQQRRWLVVNARPRCEAEAICHLQRQGFDAYCPKIRSPLRASRTGKAPAGETLKPLFPSYLFVARAAGLVHWRPILSTRGVRAVIRCGDQPSLLGDGFIAGLKSREVDGAVVRPRHSLQVGQRVEVASGPFDGIVARIIEMDEKDRLVVLMELLGGPVRVRLMSQQVVAVRAG